MKTEDEAKAIIEQFDGGADFAALAKEKSTDTGSGANGGDLGWFAKDVMVKEFADAAFAMKTGECQQGAGEEPVRLPHHQARGAAHAAGADLGQAARGDPRRTGPRRWSRHWSTSLRKDAKVEIIEPGRQAVPEEPADKSGAIGTNSRGN